MAIFDNRWNFIPERDISSFWYVNCVEKIEEV